MKEGTTKKKARERLRELENQLENGTYIPLRKVPTFAEVAEEWLKHKKPNPRASTWSVYEGHTRNHFNDVGSLKINKITVATIEKYVSKRQSDGMNILTLRKILVSFGQIMAYAARHRYIGYNPFRDAEKPKDQGKVKKKKIRVLNPDEINALIGAESSPKHKMLFRLAIMCGARQGELLGLKWSDIDWENKQIHIQRTYYNQAWYDVKTEASNRRIDIGPDTLTELKRWKVACPSNRLSLVFPNGDGQPIDHNNLVKRFFKPASDRAGVSGIRFHDLRHTFASLLIEQGENPKYIQKQLGHSNPTVTLNIYAHLFEPVNQESAIRLENAVFQTKR